MGPNYSISTACATSNFCILSAANHIIRGEAVSFQPFHFMCTFKELAGLLAGLFSTSNLFIGLLKHTAI